MVQTEDVPLYMDTCDIVLSWTSHTYIFERLLENIGNFHAREVKTASVVIRISPWSIPDFIQPSDMIQTLGLK